MNQLPHSNLNACEASGETLKESNLLDLNLNIHQLTAATSACSFLIISILVLHVQSELWPSQEQHNLWSCGFRPFSTTLTYGLTCWPQVRLLCHHSNKADTVVFQYFFRWNWECLFAVSTLPNGVFPLLLPRKHVFPYEEGDVITS